MKPMRSLIIFGVVLVLLIGALVAVKQLTPSTAVPTATPTPRPEPLLVVKVEEIYTVTVENASGTLSLLANETTGTSGSTYSWSVADPAGEYYQDDKVDSAGNGLLYYSTMVDIAQEAEDLSVFGLSNPATKVTLRLKDGSKHVVKIGDAVPGGSSYYASLDEGRRVVAVGSTIYGHAQTKPLDLLDTTLPVGGMTAENLLEIELQRAVDGLDIQFALEGTGDVKNWQIKSPIQAEADASRFTPLVGELVAIAPTEYVEMNPGDLAKYGLDVPRYTIVMKSATSEVTIRIGGDAGSGQVYFLSSAIPAVFKGSLANLPSIDTSLFNLMNRLVYLPKIWEVGRIAIDIDDQRILCEIDTEVSQSGAEGTFKLDGQDARVVDGDDDSYFRKFYVSVISVAVERFELDVTPTDTADVRIEYTDKASGAKTVLTFAKTTRDGYYFFRDGKYSGFVVNRKEFYGTEPGEEGILPGLAILRDAMKNAVDGIYATPTPAPTSGG